MQESAPSSTEAQGASAQYLAFISYSHQDQAWANWLHRKLEAYRVPASLRAEGKPARLYPIFRDREELPTAANLGTMIQEALESSEYLIVICSPRSAQSRWVNQEVLGFKAMNKADRILCLLVDGEPNATDQGQPELEAFCPGLRYAFDLEQGELSDQRVEPLAADVRESGDGKSPALLKVIAGLLGVGFDALRRREELRQRRRRTVLGAAMLGLVLLLSGLSAWALVNQQTAIQQRKLAESKEQEAVQQRSIAEKNQAKAEEAEARATKQRDIAMNMLDSLVQDIDRALQDRPGMSAVRQNIMDKAMVHLAELRDSLLLSEKDADKESRRILMIMISRIGELALVSRDEKTSMLHAEETLEIARTLLAQDPEDVDYLYVAGVAEFKMGEMLVKWGHNEAALPYFETAKTQLARVITHEPEHWKAQAGWIAVLDNEGIAHEKQARYDKAKALWHQALKGTTDMREKASDPELLETLDVYESLLNLKLSEQDWRENNLDAAKGRLEQALSTHRELVKKHPDRNSFRRELAMILYRLGQLGREQQSFDQADKYLTESQSLSEELVAMNPEHLGYQREKLMIASSRAWLLEHLGQYDQAMQLNLSLKEGYEALLASNDDDPELIRDYVVILQALASIEVRAGLQNQALDHLKLAQGTASQLKADYPGMLIYEEDYAQIIGEIGHVLMQQKQFSEALKFTRASYTDYESFVEKVGESDRYAARLSLIQYRLGLILANLNRMEEAGDYFKKSLKIRTDLHEKFPMVAARLVSRVEITQELARWYWFKKEVRTSLDLLTQSEGLLKAALKENPNQAQLELSLSSVYEVLARMEMAQKRPLQAGQYIQPCLVLRQKLSEASPDNTELLSQRLNAMELASEIYWAKGQSKDSEHIARDILRLMQMQNLKFPENPTYMNWYARAHLRVADFELGQKRYREGIARLESAVRLYFEANRKIGTVQQLLLLIGAQQRLAVVLRNLGELDKASSMLQTMTLNLNEVLIGHPEDVFLLTKKMDILYEHGRILKDHRVALRKFNECLELFDALLESKTLPQSYQPMRPYLMQEIQKREAALKAEMPQPDSKQIQ